MLYLEYNTNNLPYVLKTCWTPYDNSIETIFGIFYDKYKILSEIPKTYKFMDFIIFETDNGLFFVNNEILTEINYTEFVIIKEINKGKDLLQQITEKYIC